MCFLEHGWSALSFLVIHYDVHSGRTNRPFFDCCTLILQAFSAYILSEVGLVERWEEYMNSGLPSAKAKAKVLFDVATAAWAARVLLELEAHNMHFLPVSS